MKPATTYEAGAAEQAAPAAGTAGLLSDPSTWSGIYVIAAVVTLMGIRRTFRKLTAL